MEKGLVELGKKSDLSRYDTTIKNMLALHDRIPVAGERVNQCAAQFVLQFGRPYEGYEYLYPIGLDEQNKLEKERKIPFIEDKGYDYTKLAGTPVRVYYLHQRLVGWELREPQPEIHQ